MPHLYSAPRIVHRLLRAQSWQDRPEFGTLCNWWKGRTKGICSLVGIGGAGKTSIVDRFLQVVPGGIAPVPGIPKDDHLDALGRLLVFSFYDNPSVDGLIEEISVWLSEDDQAS